MTTPEAPEPRPGSGADSTPPQPPEPAGHPGAEPDTPAADNRPPAYGPPPTGPSGPGGYGAGAVGMPGYGPPPHAVGPGGPPHAVGPPQAVGSGGPPYGAGSGGPPYGGPFSTVSASGNRRGRWPRVGAGVAAILVALGMGAGVLIGHAAWPRSVDGGSSLGPASSVSGDQTGAAAVASKVSAALVDINVTLGYQQARAAGTGMVLTSNGEVLTNNHVIDGATSISVTDVGNGKTYGANVVGYDRTHDVAVLQLVGASGLSTVTLGNPSTVHVGESVVAVGNAGGTGGTPSYAAGSVTAVDQSIVASDQSGASQRLTGLIATDANVVAGDSGGPLVDSSGKVIGMDTAGSVSGGGRFGGGQFGGQGATGTGQGYAIPMDRAASIARQIEAGTSSSTVHIGGTPFLGVGVTDTVGGVRITSVLPGRAAARAGLTAGDTITAVDGQALTSGRSLTDLLLTKRPGDTVQIRYVDASGTQHTVSVKLASGPPQ